MRALTIDDSRAMRRIVARNLEQLGFQTLHAEHGREALEILERTDMVPELACIDWNMPVMGGLDFVHAVRSQPRLRSMTLMMVTTESEHGQIVRALAAGAHEYLVKPFTPDTMLAKLRLLGLLPGGAAP
jgi:two-component system, chemotaxis family, chemotaxis protein CheY